MISLSIHCILKHLDNLIFFGTTDYLKNNCQDRVYHYIGQFGISRLVCKLPLLKQNFDSEFADDIVIVASTSL
jgi:hypothetical protein